MTTSPKAFVATARVLTGVANVLVTPGLYPEIAHERAGELDLLLTQMGDVAAVGEVGLDGSSRYRNSYDVQRGLFEAIIEHSSALGGRVLSIHSRQAVNDVLAVLDRHAGFGTAVMHWFTGTVKELRAAEERGCWFSIGPAAFASSSGRALAAKLPRHFVVPESDGPFAQVDDKPVPPLERRPHRLAPWKSMGRFHAGSSIFAERKLSPSPGFNEAALICRALLH